MVRCGGTCENNTATGLRFRSAPDRGHSRERPPWYRQQRDLPVHETTGLCTSPACVHKTLYTRPSVCFGLRAGLPFVHHLMYTAPP